MSEIVVFTHESKYQPDRLVKKPYGVIMLWDSETKSPSRKRTVPWHQVQEVHEELEPVESDDEIARFP
jgi:hypothetical protein